MNVHYIGPDEWGARRVLKNLSGAIRDDEFGPTDIYYMAEPIPEDDPDYPEFKWRVVSKSKAELSA